MKRLALVLGIIASLAIGQTVQASTIGFGDNTIHWDGYASSNPIINSMDALNSPDYIGGNATINANGALARIDFIDNPAAHSAYAFNQYLAAGDLFLDLNADNKWDYLVKTSGNFNAGNYGLYNINNLNVTTAASDASKYEMGYARDGQPVALKSLDGATKVGDVFYSGYYDNNINSYSTYFDFGTLAIDLGNSNFIVAFGPDCGNDIIKEMVPVPEPGTMVLLGAGLLGLAVYGKRRMTKSA